MALSSKISFLLFLLTLLSSYHHIHARDSQFFNKIPSNNNVANEIQPNQEEDPLEQEPNFIPENNQNGAYGLYGHESGQLPPSTTTKTNLPYKNEVVEPNEFLPKNYNTQAYVTEPEGYHPSQETNTNNYYQTQKQGYPATTTAATNYYQNYGGNNNNNYNGQQQQQQQQQQGVNEYNLGQKSYTTSGGDSNYNNAAAGEKQKQKQGMSDTRFLENGKYFYDLNLEKNTNRYPFDNTRRFGDQYSKYGNNNENSNQFNNYSNSNDGFESKGEQFQDFQEEGLP